MSTPPTTGTRLDPILASVFANAEVRRAARGGPAAADPDPARGLRFTRGLTAPGLSFIAECKRRSPSAGTFSDEVDLAARAQSYADGGAAALSILTEEEHFHGHPDDLEAVAGAGLPRLRKDFLLTVDMVVESVAMGADAVLLLAVCLDDAQLADLRDAARDLGLAVLLEVHDGDELERALRVRPDCIGVNARDLRTFVVDLAVPETLIPQVPTDYVRVAESGITDAESARRMLAAGADAVLVGEALMRAADPTATLRQWRADLVRSTRGRGVVIAFDSRTAILAKVCGLTRPDDVRFALDAGADLVGFVSHGPSPRHLSDLQVVALSDLVRSRSAQGVLVTVDAERTAVDRLMGDAGLDGVQLCGAEEPADWGDAEYFVLRRIAVAAGAEAEMHAWRGVASAFVLDHPAAAGGTGEPVDPGWAASLAELAPCLLAGGLGPDALEAGLTPPLDSAPLVGLDASSRLETGPGLKDPVAVERFVRAAHRLMMHSSHRQR